MNHPAPSAPVEVPRGNAAGFRRYFKQDLTSGFLVFLIALPLCLGISVASGYPPMAGVFTAIVGSIIATALSNSEMTIKGPAAGLIVIAVGCVAEFTEIAKASGIAEGDAAFAAYRMALAVGVAAAVLQILFGMVRGGILSEFFPTSAVHGMLAAIGVIIILKQFPVALGEKASGEPLELVKEIPTFIAEANPAIALIGGVSLLIMFLWPVARKKLGPLGVIPAPMIVLLAAIPMGMGFDLLHDHKYAFWGHNYPLGEKYLVEMPDKVFGMFEMITFPNFAALALPAAWKWVFMFFIIGTLESVLSAKAVDLIDPWKRKTGMNRDILAVGVGNLASAAIGGLPMISEIVRSRANIDNGARTRFADMWHGVFLLVCVALFPTVLHRIPLAALAAMLVYTGYRLAHPTEFVHVYRIGREQLVIFVTTLVAVLATDLLIGIAIGIGVKVLIHVMNGVPLKSLFKTYLEVEPRDEHTCVIRARQSAVFSNWIPFRRQIEDLGLVQRQNIVLDLSGSKLIDHTVMEKLHQMRQDFEQAGLALEVIGLDAHQPLADHAFAARRLRPAVYKRITVVADEEFETLLTRRFVALGATPCMAVRCHEVARVDAAGNGAPDSRTSCVRIEAIVPATVGDRLVAFLRDEFLPRRRATVSLEAVDVIRSDSPDDPRPEHEYRTASTSPASPTSA
ncbi:MAG: SulP family inorganic anion transporter [Planctomycetaceae bacterium]